MSTISTSLPLGRPPRVRGGHGAARESLTRVRKTPACAGRTREWHTARSRPAEDPRVCGEDAGVADLAGPDAGRPPRVRGGLGAGALRGGGGGKTPACAGRTWSASVAGCPHWEDPRVCGEDGLWRLPGSPVSGRPPRVRGGLGPGAEAPGVGGKTPACAGRTLSDQELYTRGRALRISPSISIGYQRSLPAVRMAQPCSFAAGSTITT